MITEDKMKRNSVHYTASRFWIQLYKMKLAYGLKIDENLGGHRTIPVGGISRWKKYINRRKCQWCWSVNKFFLFYENSQKEFIVALAVTEECLMLKQKTVISMEEGQGLRASVRRGEIEWSADLCQQTWKSIRKSVFSAKSPFVNWNSVRARIFCFFMVKALAQNKKIH